MGYAPPGTSPLQLVALAEEAERLGFDSAWAAEAWGTDAATVLAWTGARTSRIGLGSSIMQIAARTPAATAMTAATLDLLSGGRLLLGLGVSGPQVVEGWHGQPFAQPLARVREYVEIVRSVLRRETVEHRGRHYRLPYDGPGATGLGRPLRLLARPLRAEIPIYLAALGPRSVAVAAEIADGWLPTFLDPDRLEDAFGGSLAAAPPGFEIAPTAQLLVGDDIAALRDELRPLFALYVGGMGAREQNFYNRLVRAYGWEQEAAAAVPDELIDAVALVGPPERIRDRLPAYAEAGVTTLICATTQVEALRVMAELLL